MISHIKLGYDLVIASRFMVGGKRYDADSPVPFRGFGNRVMTLILNLLFDANLIDSYQPFRAVSKDFIHNAKLNSHLLVNYQMSIRAVTMGKKILEIPSVEQQSIDRMSFSKVVWIGIRAFVLVIYEKVSILTNRNSKI